VHAGEEDHMAWMDNVKSCTGLPIEESVRMTEDRDKWRKYVLGVAYLYAYFALAFLIAHSRICVV